MIKDVTRPSWKVVRQRYWPSK